MEQQKSINNNSMDNNSVVNETATNKTELMDRISYLTKEIDDKHKKLNELNIEISIKKADIKQYELELSKLKTDYFRLKEIASEFHYNSANRKRHQSLNV